ncbi:MAG: nucleotide exchange factor GrpE [Trichloromonas sp.]|nr:nucleotide exchange factor GrpE [Trichloromonas sp.]
MAKKSEKLKEQALPAAEETAAETVEEAPAAESETPETTPTLEEQLAAAQEEARKNWDLYLRERADLENFRRRAQKEKEDLARFANENILKELLPVLDNLERALEHARQEGSGGEESLRQGVEMTLGLFAKSLEKFGVTPIQAEGAPFDPAWHEAMGQLESADHPANTVVKELQKGYQLNGRLLRPTLVMVAKAPVA